MYKVEYHPAVKKDLKKIDPQIRKKIRYEYIPIIFREMRVTAPKSNGFNFEEILGRVAELLDLKPEQLLAVGKYKKTVAARSLLCF